VNDPDLLKELVSLLENNITELWVMTDNWVGTYISGAHKIEVLRAEEYRQTELFTADNFKWKSKEAKEAFYSNMYGGIRFEHSTFTNMYKMFNDILKNSGA